MITTLGYSFFPFIIKPPRERDEKKRMNMGKWKLDKK